MHILARVILKFTMRQSLCILLLICASFVLSNCGGEPCVEADDFGYPRVTVPSRYNASANPQELFGEKDGQVGAWLDSGYSLDGRPLTIVVKNWRYSRDPNTPEFLSAWSPWYGKAGETGQLNAINRNMPTCQWQGGDVAAGLTKSEIQNAPCLLKKGIGLYALIAKPGYNPNSNINSIEAPDESNSINFHVAQNLSKPEVDYQLFDNWLPAGQTDDNIGRTNAQIVVTPQGDKSTAPPASDDNSINAPVIGDLLGHNDVTEWLDEMLGNTGNTPAENPQPAGGIVYKFEGVSDPSKFVGGRLYFKILDKHYDDNNGQYIVILKSGIQNFKRDPIQFATEIVKKKLFGGVDKQCTSNILADYNFTNPSPVLDQCIKIKTDGMVQQKFKAILGQEAFKKALYSILILYVFISAANFLIGNINITAGDFAVRCVKVAIVALLFDQNKGWAFFNDYLFSLFVEGTKYINDLMTQIVSTGPGSSSALSMLLAPQVLKKASALIFTSWIGPLYFIVFVVTLVFMAIALMRLAMLYLSSMIMLALVIISGPFFIVCGLFNITRELFEGWISQLTLYSLQMIILLAINSFIDAQVKHQMYSMLGYRVCRQDMPDFGPGLQWLNGGDGVAPPKSLFSMWIPNPIDPMHFNRTKQIIPVPEDHFTADGKYCKAFECYEARYPNFPFLDPTKESRKIKEFFTGSFSQIPELFYLVIMIYLINLLAESAIGLSRALSASSASVKIQGASNKAFEATPIFKRYNKAYNKAIGVAVVAVGLPRKGLGVAAGWVKEKRTKVSNNIQQRVYAKFALGAEYDVDTAKRVLDKYGLDRSKINAGVAKQYDAHMKDLVGNIPNLPASHQKYLLDNAGKPEDVLAQAKYGVGKSYASLSAAEQKEVRDLLDKPDKNGKSILALKKEREQYQRYKALYGHERVAKKERLKKEREKEKYKDKHIKRGDYIAAGLDSIEKSLAQIAGLKERYDFVNLSQLTDKEKAADKKVEDSHKQLEKNIEAQRRAHGADVLDPAYQAQLKANNPQVAANFQKMAEDILRKEIYEQVRLSPDMNVKEIIYKKDPQGNIAIAKNGMPVIDHKKTKWHNENPPHMGDQYIRHRMNDKEFVEALNKLEDQRKVLKERDNEKYAADRDGLNLSNAQHAKAALAIIDQREKIIDVEIDKERQRLIDLYGGNGQQLARQQQALLKAQGAGPGQQPQPGNAGAGQNAPQGQVPPPPKALGPNPQGQVGQGAQPQGQAGQQNLPGAAPGAGPNNKKK